MLQEHEQTGRLAASIANAVVRHLAAVTGRGPTKSRTTLDADSIFVVVQEMLTRGEQALVRAGNAEIVHDAREAWHRIVREPLSREVEALTGRRVAGCVFAHSLEANLATVAFILEPED